MNDLPTPASGTSVHPVISGGISSKEKEVGGSVVEMPIRPVVTETELSPEVVSSGVKVQPATVTIPASVQQLGVQPAGQNIPVPAPTITLPLTDDQIAAGLKQGVWSSVRWLSEWCVRKLKQVHMGMKNIHGKLIRVRE